MSSTINERKSSRIQVLEAIHSLYEQEVDVTIDSLVRYTNLKTVTVNDCIKELKERDEIWSLERGVYRPKMRHEQSRSPSLTMLPNGMVKLEIGDTVENLTPREVALLAPFFAGISMQIAASSYNHNVMMMGDRIAKAERKVRALECAGKQDNGPSLIEDAEAKEDPRQLKIEA
jgi:predicted transcriptional regulator